MSAVDRFLHQAHPEGVYPASIENIRTQLQCDIRNDIMQYRGHSYAESNFTRPYFKYLRSEQGFMLLIFAAWKR